MTVREIEKLKRFEDMHYNHMRFSAKVYGRQSEEFQTARAAWFSIYELLCSFDIKPIKDE